MERDEDNSTLTLEGLDEDPMQDIHSHSVTYRIAMGPQRGRKVFALQSIPPKPDLPPGSERVAKLAGFSLHAGVAAKTHQCDKLERLCRYISRPAVSEKRLSLTSTGKVRYELKTPYRNGTTHVIFEPVDFIARLAALVPKPRVNLTRFHGVFAPNSKHRIHVTPAKRGKGRKDLEPRRWDEKTQLEQHAAMTWMQRLKRVFNIDIEICEKCKGPVKIIACVEDPIIIKKILEHIKQKGTPSNTARSPPGKTPPQIELFERA